MIRRTCATIGLLLAFAFAAPFSGAQSPAPAAESEPTPPEEAEEPEAPVAATVAGDARVALSELTELTEGLGDDAELESVRTGLAPLETRLRADVEETTRELESEDLAMAIADMESRWRSERSDLAAWDGIVTSRAVAIGERLSRIEEIGGDWKRRLEKSNDPDIPKIVRTRIREVLSAVGVATQEVNSAQANLLELQDRLEGTVQLVVDMLDEIVAAKDRSRSAMLTATGDPLWVRLAASSDQSGVDAIRAHLRESAASVQDWAIRRSEGIGVLAVLFAVFLGMALALRRLAPGLANDDPSLQRSADILARPVSVAIVLALLNFLLLSPVLPRAVASLMGVVVIVPLVIALRPAFPERSRPALYALTAFFFVERFREIVSGSAVLADSLYGLELLLVILVFGWLYRTRRIREMASGPTWVRILDVAQPIVLGLFVVAFFADVFGRLGLSQLLGVATLRAVVRAFAVWGLIQVTHAIVAMSLRSSWGQRLHVVRRRGDVLRAGINTALQLGFGVFWLLATLDDFGIRNVVTEGAGGILGSHLQVGTLDFSLGDILTFVVSVILAIYAARFVAFFLDEEVMPRVQLPRGVPYAISATARYAVLTLGFMVAVSAAGIDLSRFAVLVGALGVGIGFGMQNIVNNFVSGMILLFERPIQAGDTISLGELMGEVRHIGIRASTIRSFDGAEVIVPNANLISDLVINWTLSDRQRRMEIPVGVAYGTDPEAVIELLLGVVDAREDLWKGGGSDIHFMGFGESSLDFRVRVWAENFDDFWNVRSSIAVDINRALAEAGIEIPFPQRDLHLRSADADALGTVSEKLE